MKLITAGYGDEATWPDYDGHPNDPRHDEEHENELLILEDTADFVDWLRTSRDDDIFYDLLTSDDPADVIRARNILRAAYLKEVIE